MSLISHFIYSLFGTVGYAIYFQVPIRLLPSLGFIGGSGWVLYIIMTEQLAIGSSSANLCSALLVALLSELAARATKNPVTMFVIPGIIPLVPGYTLYKTIYYISQNNMDLGLASGLSALASAGAIAIGVMLISSFGKISMKIVSKKSKKKIS